MRFSPLVLNSFAIAYVLVIYLLGVTLLILHAWQFNMIGVILVVHALVLSTTFTHEFIHNTIFKARSLDSFWGVLMTHLNGACYATWDELVERYLNHHLYHADFVGFNIQTHFEQMNPWLRWVYIALEWLYLPVLEFELRHQTLYQESGGGLLPLPQLI